jgi:hypothetical protein
MGNLVITIEPEDTLDLLPGKYFYAIKMHIDHFEPGTEETGYAGKQVDKVVTLINKTKFIIND